MKLGLIGFGRLGKLLASKLSQDFDCYIYDVEKQDELITSMGAIPASLEEISKIQTIISVVPISALKDLLKEISPLLKDDHLFIDVCSVKELPSIWMKEALPENVQILGTHPMFGPDSAKRTLVGSKIVLCPVRIEERSLKEISAYLETHGLKVIHATAKEHDQQIAQSLLLTHFLGRTMIDFGSLPLEIDTKGYRRLMKILETVENDTWQLFVDMNKYNPYAQGIRQRFLASMQKIDNEVKE